MSKVLGAESSLHKAKNSKMIKLLGVDHNDLGGEDLEKIKEMENLPTLNWQI